VPCSTGDCSAIRKYCWSGAVRGLKPAGRSCLETVWTLDALSDIQAGAVGGAAEQQALGNNAEGYAGLVSAGGLPLQRVGRYLAL
jgi:hypothetical protein